MLPLVPVLDESRPLDRLGLHAVGQGLPDGNGRRCRNEQCAALHRGRRQEKGRRPGQRGLVRLIPGRHDRMGAARSGNALGVQPRLAASSPSLGPKPEAGPRGGSGTRRVRALGPALEGPPGRSARAWATSGMPARLHNVLRQHPRHRGSPSEPSGRSVTDWASVAVREAARGRKAARTRQAHVSAYS
jgi:hypothetical protein